MAPKILKTCNCCCTGRESVRLMGQGARKAYCRNCHVQTYWSPASAEVIARVDARHARNVALMAELLGDDA
jgi:hypothetical protein